MNSKQDKISILNKGQKDALDIAKAFWVSKEQCMVLGGRAGTGKALPITDPVLTPDGFKPMKDIHVGDYVISEKGLPIKVLWESELQELNIYRMYFADGTFIDSCQDHLWKVQTEKQRSNGTYYIKSTLELYNNKPYKLAKKKSYKYIVPTCEAVHFPKKDLLIHPYILGYLLGNGCSQEKSLIATCWVNDAEEIGNLINYFDSSCLMSHRHVENVVHYAFKKSFRDKYNSLDLYKIRSKNKFIPKIYLHSSIEDRLYLLQGLMDSDGCCNNNKARFSSTSLSLTKDVQWLVKSLGGTANISISDRRYNGKTIEYTLSIRLDKNPFLLTRKSTNYKIIKQDFKHFKAISDIEYNRVDIGKCISVDSKEKLYVIKDFTVTHNSFLIDTLVTELPNCKPILLAPTNEALFQIRDKITSDFLLKTVHSALGIAPTTTEKELSFVHTKIPSFWDDYNLCVIDEASMLEDWIIKLVESIKIKIIYAGHESQLPPVKENRSIYDRCISPVFDKGYLTYTLKEPMRNKGDLWSFNNILEECIYDNKKVIPSTYDIKAKDLRDYLKSPTGINDFFDGNTKIVVWTNAAVDAYNIRIRESLFPNKKEFFLPGDKIILKNPLNIIENLEFFTGTMLKKFSTKKDLDYIYANSKFTVLQVDHVKVDLEKDVFLRCYKLKVISSEGMYTIYVPKDEKGLYYASQYYEQMAYRAKNKVEKDKRWKERHFILSCFAKVKHFYCATSHTLQGSGFKKIIVINKDIEKNPNQIERAKLRYVACSRAMDELMYFKELTL